MPERRKNCKKRQIVSNTNNNRMPERRENCDFLQFSLLSGILLWLIFLTICFLQFTLLSGILLWLECRKEEKIVKKDKSSVILTTIECRKEEKIVKNYDYLFIYNFLFFPAFYCG
jgi:hypothetical protein